MKIELTKYQAQQIELALIDREIKLKKIIDEDYFKPVIDEGKIPEELSEIRGFKMALATTMLLLLEVQRKQFEETKNEHKQQSKDLQN